MSSLVTDLYITFSFYYHLFNNKREHFKSLFTTLLFKRLDGVRQFNALCPFVSTKKTFYPFHYSNNRFLICGNSLDVVIIHRITSILPYIPNQ